MGYDIYTSGDWEIGEDNAGDAIQAMLKGYAEKDGYNTIEDWIKAEEPIPDPLEDPMRYIENRLERATIYWTDDVVGFSIGFGDDCIRTPQDDEWLFEILAPFADPDAYIHFEGEDGYKWTWEVENGEFVEIGSETVYGNDVNAPAVLQKIVAVIYDPENDDLPLSALQGVDHEAIISQIENIIREGGFGPQAGKSELDRLADV